MEKLSEKVEENEADSFVLTPYGFLNTRLFIIVLRF